MEVRLKDAGKPFSPTAFNNSKTIDERVKSIIETKRDLGDFLVDGKETISSKLQDEMRQILLEL